MSRSSPYRINEPFSPDSALAKYFFLSFAIVVIVAIPFCLGMVVITGGIVGILISAPVIAVLAFTLYWLPLYYRSIRYELTPTEITWRRGVWFRQNAIVPYSRITNVDIIQGPVMRLFGISSLRIQTAGYSAQPNAELRLDGITDPETLREGIMRSVRSGPGVATESGGEEIQQSPNDPLLEEIRQIRITLERIDQKIR